MNIGLISDCHLENPGEVERLIELLPAPGSIDVYIAAGDLTSGRNLKRFAEIAVNALDCPVIVVPGNHEYYDTYPMSIDAQAIEDMWRDDLASVRGAHLLINGCVEIDGVSFFGSTWWTNFSLMGTEYIQDQKILHASQHDFQRIIKRSSSGTIKFMTPDDYIEMNLVAKAKFKSWRKSNDKVGRVAICHFPMLADLSNPNFSKSSYHVSSDDNFFMQNKPDLLIFGHTHYNFDTEIHGVRCVSNMYGLASVDCDHTYRKNITISV